MNRYWNPAGAANWNDVNSWSATDGGATGETVPTVDDDVFFTGTNVNDCTINANVIMKSLTTSGYTGTLTQDTTGTRTFAVAETITSTGTLKIYGNAANVRLLLRQGVSNNAVTSAPGQGTITINVAGIETAYVDFQDCIGAGTADWDLTKQATDSSGDCGGNSGITFTTAQAQTWTNADGGNWNDAGNWSGRVPLPQDDCNLGIAYNASKTVTPNMARLGKNIDFTGATWTTAFTWGGGIRTIYGSITLVNGMTVTGGSTAIVMSPRTPVTITSNGASLSTGITILGTSTVSLADDITVVTGNSTPYSILIRAGTFDTNGYNSTLSRYGLIGGNLYLRDGTHDSKGGIVFTYSGGNLFAGTSTIKSSPMAENNALFTGSLGTAEGPRFHNLWFDWGTKNDSIQIQGSCSFNEIKDTGTAAHTMYFHTGSTTTVNKFTVNGNAGQLITINTGESNVAKTGRHYLVKSSRGENVCNYLNIQHSVARPSKTWFASNSTNNQSTDDSGDGWIFKLRGKRIMHNAIVK